MDVLTTKYLRALISYDGIQRIETLPIPREALREALLNAIVHKSYESLTPIQIGVYDDKLEIWDCGVLPENWTINNLLGKHRSRPYNPDIANVFFRAGEIEAWGRGIERIVAACKSAGYPTPEFQYDSGGLWTTFHFDENYQKATFGTTQETTQRRTELQIEIIKYLKTNPNATRRELAKAIANSSIDGIKYNLSKLQKIGVLKRIGSTKSGHWEVNE